AVATQANDAIEVKAGELTVRVDKGTGLLSELSRAGQKLSLANGPRLVFERSADLRIGAKGTNSQRADLEIGAPTSTLTNISVLQDGPDCVVSAKFSGGLKSILWRVNGNGWVQCDYRFAVSGTNECFGVAFDYPQDYVKSKR